MTQTLETPTMLSPTRRRPRPALPVLIRIPTLAPSGASRRRTPRRRLRREVRVAALALLSILPLTLSIFALAGDRVIPRAAPVAADGEALGRPGAPSITISLEPVVTVRRDLETPVFLPGYLLPVEAAEESSDGGH